MTSSTVRNDKSFYDFLVQEYGWPFEGWNFSHITRTGRMVDGPLSWSYGSIVLNHIHESRSLLDLGTGGGELLASLRPLPKFTRATESYHSNVAVARRRLEPFGVKVMGTSEGAALPFPDETFELVIDRHESYRPSGYFASLGQGDGSSPSRSAVGTTTRSKRSSKRRGSARHGGTCGLRTAS